MGKLNMDGHYAVTKTDYHDMQARIKELSDALQQLHDIMKMGGFDCPELDTAAELLGGGHGI